jgi:aspartate aminotransferase-like enzyme/phosphoglycerate dehydrogenase-like enzyme
MTANRAFGLSALPPRVASAVAHTYGHHRTPWFEDLLVRTSDRLRSALGERYTPLFLTCTGLGGYEAIVANLVRSDDCVHASDGPFADLARHWGAAVGSIGSDARSLARPHAVFVAHVSRDGGVVDVNSIAASVRSQSNDCPIVVDATVSFGADFVDARAWDVDALLIVPERALMGIPGMTIVAVSDGFMETVARRRVGLCEAPFLYDLLRYHRSWTAHTTPFSPNISAAIALDAALNEIESDGGLSKLPERHASRAKRIRDRLRQIGVEPADGAVTNAFTTCALPARVDRIAIAGALRVAGFSAHHDETTQVRPKPGAVGRLKAAPTHDAPLQIGHSGYMTDEAVNLLLRTLERALSGETASDASAAAQASAPEPSEPPFSIHVTEFRDQARRAVERATSDASVRAKVYASARRIFQKRHRVDETALRHRVVGFLGAGRIVRCAVDQCRQRGIENLVVYSPSLASADPTPAGQLEVAKWHARGVAIASSLEGLFEQAHSLILLPVVYDEAAVRLFRKRPEYCNAGLVNARLLERAERAGRLDLIINAAARSALIDRRAVAAAVQDGWLRYYSDEMPRPGDPLLAYPEALFTGHVGGSCPTTQAAVATNTHGILQHIVRGLLEGEIDTDAAADGPINVVNSFLLKDWMVRSRREAAAQELRRGPLRVLLTDPFDVQALAFDRLRSLGIELEIHDRSHDQLAGPGLIDAVQLVRPHIVMLRSRTSVDARVAAALAGIEALVCVIRPGVGVDNLHPGLEALSEAGIPVINEPYGNSTAVAEMALHMLLSGTEPTLLAPGPTKFQPDVFDVLAQYDDVRRSDAAIVDVETNVAAALAERMGSRREALIVSGPGTALMEASITSLTLPEARGIVISHGKFGDRFVDIARARHRNVEELRVPEARWGDVVLPGDLDRFLQSQSMFTPVTTTPISFLCFQQNETSSGVTYHHAAIRQIVRVARAYNPDMMVIVDAISGALAHRLAFDELDVDALFLGSQKALGVSSGLAFALLSDRAHRFMLDRAGYRGTADTFPQTASRHEYLDRFDRLQRVHSVSLLRSFVNRNRGELADTASLFHLLSTERALALFDQEGDANAVADRHAKLAEMVRDGVRDLGLKCMAHPPFHSDSVTVVVVPPELSAPAIRKAVAKETGIALAGAQGDYWKARSFRIGTLGFVTHSDIRRALRALRVVLADARAPQTVEHQHEAST